MKILDEYFTGLYVVRLNGLREKVVNHIPEEDATQETVKEFGGWLQKELDFFYAGTHSQLKTMFGTLENITDKRYKLLVSVEFINNYLLGQVTERQIKELIGGAKVSTAELNS